MRVLHVHRIGGIGGSERHLLTLLPALAARGVEVSFIGLDLPGADPFYAALRRLEIPFQRLTGPVQLGRAVTRLRPDILHTHLVHADVYGGLLLGVPLVSTKHNPDPFRAGPWRLAERLLARRARRLIAISESLRRFSMERVGLSAEKIDVVHYGLDELPEPWATNRPLALQDSAPLLLCVARLAPQKGVDTAVRALASIPDATLLVLGDGPERNGLTALARDLGVADRVLMPGRVGDVAELYRQCSLLVHPARWEGFGLAMLEAMLAGKPVVAARAASAPEIVVDGETGSLVPPDDPTALAGAVLSLLSDEERRAAYGRAGLERARSKFSVERMAELTIEVYAAAGRRPLRPSSTAR